MQAQKLPVWKMALMQSLFIGGYLAVTFFVVGWAQGRLAMASLAASAFIAFAFGKGQAAKPRALVGGYACGIVLGGLCCLLLHTLPMGAQNNRSVVILFCALASLLCCFFMVMLRVQHPPASALALSMVLEQNPLPIGIATMVCIIGLAFARWLALRYLEPYFDSPN